MTGRDWTESRRMSPKQFCHFMLSKCACRPMAWSFRCFLSYLTDQNMFLNVFASTQLIDRGSSCSEWGKVLLCCRGIDGQVPLSLVSSSFDSVTFSSIALLQLLYDNLQMSYETRIGHWINGDWNTSNPSPTTFVILFRNRNRSLNFFFFFSRRRLRIEISQALIF